RLNVRKGRNKRLVHPNTNHPKTNTLIKSNQRDIVGRHAEIACLCQMRNRETLREQADLVASGSAHHVNNVLTNRHHDLNFVAHRYAIVLYPTRLCNHSITSKRLQHYVKPLNPVNVTNKSERH